MIRPELRAAAWRWREVIGAGVAALAGLWLATRGGFLLAAMGGALALAGAIAALHGMRRMRFAGSADAPGVVEVDERQIAWFGPGIGGFVALDELSEVGAVTVAGLRCWRLVQQDGRMLLVPVSARGAERLYDALTALPGLDGASLLSARDAPEDRPRLWLRNRPPALT
ncbi:MAG: hypothetical protein ACK4KW_03030 [Gemmobacter sp.]